MRRGRCVLKSSWLTAVEWFRSPIGNDQINLDSTQCPLCSQPDGCLEIRQNRPPFCAHSLSSLSISPVFPGCFCIKRPSLSCRGQELESPWRRSSKVNSAQACAQSRWFDFLCKTAVHHEVVRPMTCVQPWIGCTTGCHLMIGHGRNHRSRVR